MRHNNCTLLQVGNRMEIAKSTRQLVLDCLERLIYQLWQYQISSSRVCQLVQNLVWLKADVESNALAVTDSWEISLVCAQYLSCSDSLSGAIKAASDLPSLLRSPEERDFVYHLNLYIAGSSTTSVRALENLRRMCSHLSEPYKCDIIDIVKNPEQAAEEKIIVTPTLVRVNPLPKRRIIGDLADLQTALIVVCTALPDELHAAFGKHDQTDRFTGI